MSATAEHLATTLETALLRQLADLWRDFNWRYFRESMKAPALALSNAEGYLGRWFSATRTLAISRKLAFEQPWEVVEEVLKHEMAHQYVDEVLHASDEAPHGPQFRSVCERLGIDPAASGLPAAPLEGSESRVVEKIARLLTLAGSENQHEAEAAAVAARRLMLKHNLDVQSAPKRYAFRRLGNPSGRAEESARIVAGILGEHFFVEVLWVPVFVPAKAKRAWVVEIMGTPENLAIAEYVHIFLHRSAEQLWRAHQSASGLRSNRDRRTFVAGVMSGFREKLAGEKRTQESRALVWVKDPELQSYLRRRHPRTSMRSHAGRVRNESFHQGRAAGKKLVLSKSIDTKAAARGRLLGPGK